MYMPQESIPFNPDLREEWPYKSRTPADAINRSVPPEKEELYLREANGDQEQTELYQTLTSIAIDIDHIHGDRNRLGGAFLDGGVVASDILIKFAPRLFNRVEASVAELHRTKVKKHYPEDASEIPEVDESIRERMFVSDLIQYKGGHTKRFVRPDGERLINRLAHARYDTPEQHQIMFEGFRFLMSHVEKVYDADKIAMSDLAKKAMTLAELNAELEDLIAQSDRNNL